MAAGEEGEVTRGSVRVRHGCILDTDKKKEEEVYGRDAGSPAARCWRKKVFVSTIQSVLIRSDSTTLPIVLPRQPKLYSSDQI